jgi:hypothetical protein
MPSKLNQSSAIGFPFDITHIRRIEYENSATGGKKLEMDLIATINSFDKPLVDFLIKNVKYTTIVEKV